MIYFSKIDGVQEGHPGLGDASSDSDSQSSSSFDSSSEDEETDDEESDEDNEFKSERTLVRRRSHNFSGKPLSDFHPYCSMSNNGCIAIWYFGIDRKTLYATK